MIIKRLHIISVFLFTMTVVLCLPSCINENDSMCVQFDVGHQLVDTAGAVLPDSLIGRLKAYLYLDGKFSNIVTSSSDGRFQISFYKNSTASLVLIASPRKDSIDINEPKVGDDIDNYALSVNSISGFDDFYYGRFDYTPNSSNSQWQTVTNLTNMRAHVHVLVKDLNTVFGNEGTYSVKLSGLHSSITFAGTADGDSITATPAVTFLINGDLLSDKVSAWPTKNGESVTLAILKDGNPIWVSNLDSSGKPVKLYAGDDKVFLVDCSQMKLNITVLTWSKYSQNLIFY
jgi:hypothetical protein